MEESKENDLKIQKLAQKMKEMGKQEMDLQEKLKNSEANIAKFRSVIRKVDKMKCE